MERAVFSQYHYSPFNTIKYYGGVTTCFYPLDAMPTEEGEPSPGLYRFTRGLADKSRLRILRYLAKGPRSYIEVVREIGLAKSLIHDHMVTLRSAGLIRAHVTGDTVTAYSLREEAFDLMKAELDAYTKNT